jgi:hypothetical protein
MNILYINHYAGSVYHGMEYRPYHLAKEWIKSGHKVTIIAANYSHLRHNNPPIIQKQNYINELIDGIEYFWIKTPKYSGNGIKRLLNILTFLYRLNNKLHHKLLTINPDIVIASSTYPFDIYFATKIAKQNKAKVIYEVHDLWPLTLIELNGMSKYHPLIYLMQQAQNFAYRNADLVVSLLSNAKSYMVEHGLSPNKFNTITNGITNIDSTPLSSDLITQIRTIKQQFKTLIGYAGSIGRANALNDIVVAMQNNPNIALVIAGNGPCKSELTQLITKKKITNVFLLGYINKLSVANFLSQMDFLYLGWQNLPIYRFGISPNKLFEYMLAAKPIIHATPDTLPPQHNLVLTAQCGVVALAQDINSIDQVIKKVVALPKEQLQIMGKNGYAYVTQNYNYVHLAKQFLLLCS